MTKTMFEITNLGVYRKAYAWSTNELATRAEKFAHKVKHWPFFGHLGCMSVTHHKVQGVLSNKFSEHLEFK